MKQKDGRSLRDLTPASSRLYADRVPSPLEEAAMRVGVFGGAFDPGPLIGGRRRQGKAPQPAPAAPSHRGFATFSLLPRPHVVYIPYIPPGLSTAPTQARATSNGVEAVKKFLRKWLARKSSRPAPAVRLRLEALETRLTPSAAVAQTAVLLTNGELDLFNPQTGTFQTLSPAGTISSVSAAQAAGGPTAVFAIPQGADAGGNAHTLWEYNAAAGGWSEISAGYFQQISAATDANGNPVVFGILGQQTFAPAYVGSLWEYNGGGWQEVAGANLGSSPPQPGPVAFVSAVGTAQGPVAIAIAASDRSLWEFNASGQWTQISTGVFNQVSAGRDANGLADVFATVGTALANDVWEFQNNGWTALTGPFVPPIRGFGLTRIAELPTDWQVTAGDNGKAFVTSRGGTGLMQFGVSTAFAFVSAGGSSYFNQVSATETSGGADVAFAALSDGSLWQFIGGAGWAELLSGGVAETATPL